jgi:hypothetical protein
MIKFGNHAFDDWELLSHPTLTVWIKRTYHGHEHILIGSDDLNTWHVQVGYDLNFLHRIFRQDILIGNVEEVKQTLDNLLLKISRLVPFI